MLEQTRLYAESWNVAWRKSKPGTILTDQELPFTVIPNSYRYWVADPFVFEKQGRTFIFAELYDYIRCKGIIGYCEINGQTKPKWKPIIIENYHLSFPYIYEENGDIYILPESSQNGTLYRYKATEFPDSWQKVAAWRTDVKYVDTILLGNKYALTYNIEDKAMPKLCLLELQNGNDHELPICAPELRRPAGKAIEDFQIRSAQDCCGEYGKGLIFYKYSFNGKNYSENEIMRIYPQNIILSKKMYLDGMHTYNYCQNYEVIDIKTRRFNLLNFTIRLLNLVIRR